MEITVGGCTYFLNFLSGIIICGKLLTDAFAYFELFITPSWLLHNWKTIHVRITPPH